MSIYEQEVDRCYFICSFKWFYIKRNWKKYDSVLKLEKNCFYVPICVTVLYLGYYGPQIECKKIDFIMA
jgi:hypothetical protein